MSELLGHVDERERPLIRVPIPDRDRSFLALVDTGFNGWLFMEAADAVSLGFVLSELAVSVEFAGRGQSRVGIERLVTGGCGCFEGRHCGHESSGLRPCKGVDTRPEGMV